jgi:hypothetical protein
MSRRAANLIVMPSAPTQARLVAPCAAQLACVNRKIAERITNRPNAHVHAIFANTAFLAGKAIEAATELQQMPGATPEAFADTLEFWYRVRDYAGTAALDCLGGNNTLAEALVTFRFLNCRGPK